MDGWITGKEYNHAFTFFVLVLFMFIFISRNIHSLFVVASRLRHRRRKSFPWFSHFKYFLLVVIWTHIHTHTHVGVSPYFLSRKILFFIQYTHIHIYGDYWRWIKIKHVLPCSVSCYFYFIYSYSSSLCIVCALKWIKWCIYVYS